MRRLLLLTGLAAVVGLAAGGAAWALVHLIGLITNLVLFHQWAWKAPSFSTLDRSPLLILAAMGGGLAVSLLALWSPVIKGHGIPEAMEAVLTKQSRIAPRTAIAKPLSAAISIGTGGPFGAEGPIIVTGGALGSLVGQLIPMSPSERKILLASGAAAGMAATFGTPLAAVVLAIELLLFELSTRSFIPLVVASAVAGGVHATLFGDAAFFATPDHRFAGLGTLPVFALLGLGAGLLAVIVCKGLFAVEAGFRRLPVKPFWHPVIGGAVFGAVGLIEPRALGVGYDAITDILDNRLALGAVAVLAAVKLVAWWVALGSGTSGGTLAPILLISAGFGSLFGAAAQHVVPSIGVSQGAFALVAMAAVFGAATRATFTSIIFVFELTGDYKAILPLMVASVIADLVATGMLHDSLMTEKLSRRGLRVHADYEVDVLRTAFVRDLMSTEVETVPVTATPDDLRERFARGRHSAYPLVDGDGHCVGIVTRGDVLRDTIEEDAVSSRHRADDVVTVAPGDLGIVALQRMLEEGVDHLPVIEQGRLVGICTRTDILRVRHERFALERVQPGWRPARARINRR
ncbi:MAG: hypothetical protein QOE63_213 [Acidimicrobiaceae bacterium]|jgi:H+/Cl- antiporter ClcA/predicted transcriptional regulator